MYMYNWTCATPLQKMYIVHASHTPADSNYWIPLQQIGPCWVWIADRIPDPHIVKAIVTPPSNDILSFLDQELEKLYERGQMNATFRTKNTNQAWRENQHQSVAWNWTQFEAGAENISREFAADCKFGFCSKLIHPLDLAVTRWL